MRAFYALFLARNREFLRDRGTMAWNFLFPFLVIVALALVFTGSGRELYKVGLVGPAGARGGIRDGIRDSAAAPPALRAFLATRWVLFVPEDDLRAAQDKVRHHQYDMVLELVGSPRYWVNASNPKGYFLERVLWGAGAPNGFDRQVLEGREIRYVDWLLPGVLAMNIMFSCLWGVGYVIVRYRKGGILRRLKASPLTAFQFISAQIASRLILVLFVTSVLFFGMDLVLDFYRLGSLFDLFLVFMLGAVCLIALGILISSRTHSQELAGGLLNLATWPMMLLSGVWFSLEGAHPWLVALAQALPLTHLINAARRIMVDGATLAGVWPELAVVTGMTAVFLAIGSSLFRWE
jgi:ABC-type multidrug transport system permease subunit